MLVNPCGVPWGICPSCIGEGLLVTDGRARCPRCFRAWPVGQREPCPDAGEVELVDETGAKARVCPSHAAHPSARRLVRS